MPEPRIVFGAFNPRTALPLQPGETDMLIGYGIIDLPPSVTRSIWDSTPSHYLQAHLRDIKLKIEHEESKRKIDQHPNPLELLVGAKVDAVYTGWCRVEIYLNLAGIGGFVQFSTYKEISDPIIYDMRTVAKVDGNVLIFEDGSKFDTLRATQQSMTISHDLARSLASRIG